MTSRRQSLCLICIAFFFWGLLRALNDVLAAAYQMYRPSFDFESMLIHSSFFAAYLLLPIPASIWLRHRGLQVGLVSSAALMATGAIVCAVGLHQRFWLLCLGSLFLIAAGIALLQTVANPSVALLGSPGRTAGRLLLTQSLSSLGSVVAPLAALCNWNHVIRSELFLDLHRMVLLYLIVAPLLLLLAFGFALLTLSDLKPPPPRNRTPLRLKIPSRLALGALAIFLFVGTEATVLGHLVRYFRAIPAYGGSARSAGFALSGYWILVTLSRLFSARLLHGVASARALSITSLAAALLVGLAAVRPGLLGGTGLIATGLFNASIFPLVFTLSTVGLDAEDLTAASGILMTAIVGGGVLPFLSGLLTDRIGFRSALLLPLASYLWIAFTSNRYESRIVTVKAAP